MSHSKSVCAFVFLVACEIASPAFANPSWRLIAGAGTPVPSAGPNANFFGVDLPTLNDAGQAAMSAIVVDAASPDLNGEGLWVIGPDGSQTRIMQAVQPAPGAPTGVNFRDLHNSDLVPINAAGHIAFLANLMGPGVHVGDNDEALYKSGPAGLQSIARLRDMPPGAQFDAYYNGFRHPPAPRPALNDLGHVAFDASTNHGGGVWRETTTASLHPVALGNTPAPEAGPDLEFHSFSGAVFNNNGDVAFNALVFNGTTAPLYVSVWRAPASGPRQLLAREGHDVTARGQTITHGSVSFPDLNDAGVVAFHDIVFIPLPVGFDVDARLWRATPGQPLELVARSGDPAPGVPAGVTFDNFSNSVINAQSRMAFYGRLEGPGVDSLSNLGVWAHDASGQLQLIARQGDPAPGVEAGIRFGLPESISINASGQVAFITTLQGFPLVNQGRSIWATNPEGELVQIVRAGDAYDFDPGPAESLKYIEQVFFAGGSGNQDGLPSGFNDRGQLAFAVRFSDGATAAFLSNTAAAPPSPADLDEDGDVDSLDFQTWSNAFGEDAAGDIDDDGLTTGEDFLAWQRAFGALTLPPASVAAATNVPEPSANLLIALAALAAANVGGHSSQRFRLRMRAAPTPDDR